MSPLPCLKLVSGCRFPPRIKANPFIMVKKVLPNLSPAYLLVFSLNTPDFCPWLNLSPQAPTHQGFSVSWWAHEAPHLETSPGVLTPPSSPGWVSLCASVSSPLRCPFLPEAFLPPHQPPQVWELLLYIPMEVLSIFPAVLWLPVDFSGSRSNCKFLRAKPFTATFPTPSHCVWHLVDAW